MGLFESNFEKKVYIKDTSSDPIFRSVNKAFFFRSLLLPATLFLSGFLILGTQVVYPLVYFKTHDDTSVKAVSQSVLGVATGFSEFEFDELKKGVSANLANENVPEYFTVSIPKLGIQDALVETNAPTLNPDQALGHYSGSALPGKPGNMFIYGHSVLPWFYNPRNYKTIFSTLDNLKTGDEVLVNYNNRQYKYVVENSAVLGVNDVNPLGLIKPKYLNESTMVLMTCWPAGTKAKRLLVNTVLVD